MLHNNSLYPALRRFGEAGAVTKTAESQEGRPPRLVYTLTDVGRGLPHDMPAEQAGQPEEFLARLGQFSLLNPAERTGVLAARARAVQGQLAHYEVMHKLAVGHGEPWGAGLVLVAIAAVGALGALALPAVRNTAMACS